MRFPKLLFILMIFSLLPISALAGEAPLISGVFTRVPGHGYESNGKTIEVTEFMSFYCSHCYAFEKAIPVIKGNFPRKIKWKTIPVYWGQGSSKPGEAYLLAEEAGKGEQMKAALFKANFVEKQDIGKVEALEAIAAKVGLGFDFSMKLRSGEKANEARKALEMMRAYGVEETPTVIIAGNIMTAAGSFSSIDVFRDNVITIIKSILNPAK